MRMNIFRRLLSRNFQRFYKAIYERDTIILSILYVCVCNTRRFEIL